MLFDITSHFKKQSAYSIIVGTVIEYALFLRISKIIPDSAILKIIESLTKKYQYMIITFDKSKIYFSKQEKYPSKAIALEGYFLEKD